MVSPKVKNQPFSSRTCIAIATPQSMKAWLHDDLPGDQRDPHNSGTAVSADELARLGVLYRRLTTQEQVDAVAIERGYRNRDIVTITVEGLGGPESYASKLATFYDEHLHDDEEIRYALEGEGYFDVRNAGDQWIRVLLEANDLIVLPQGIFHRFTPTQTNYIKALRLFKDQPKWEAHSRSGEGPALAKSESRTQYLASLA